MSDDPLRELGKQLPWHRPGDERREAMRSALLVTVTETMTPVARRRWVLVAGGFAAGALAAAAVAVLVMRTIDRSSEGEHVAAGHAEIESSSAAELEHTRTPTATGTDELVRVRAGTVRLAVPAVRAGDHVRVQTADAEIEGSGSYEVVVAADALASVVVTAGTASVKVKSQPHMVVLAAGQAWHAPVVTAELPMPAHLDVPTRPAPTDRSGTPSDEPGPVVPTSPSGPSPGDRAMTRPSTPSPRTAAAASDRAVARAPTPPPATAAAASDRERLMTVPTPSTPAPQEPSASHATVVAPRAAVTELASSASGSPAAASGPSPTEQHFRAGWALLRAGNTVDAAAELGLAADTGAEPLASDARYFQAVALVKARRGADAERALVAFLDHAPTSVRRGRAAVMLGRLLVDRGARTSARAWFEAATRDPDPAVAAAGHAGLASLSR